jgi:hypothetical protein
MQKSPTPEQIAAALDVASEAIEHSAATRKRVGRRRTPKRAAQLTAARERCAHAAEPLRSFIGMIAWHDIPVEQELAMKKAMEKLRYERRQIDKMNLTDA